MPEFAWRAAQPDGQLVEGRTEAGAADAVLRQLRERGLTPLRVQDAAEAPVAAAKPVVVFADVETRFGAVRATLSKWEIDGQPVAW